MRGRKPLPTNVVELRGNPSKKAINHDEPVCDALLDVPEPPRKLDREARREWDRVIHFIVSNRLCGVEGLSAVATLCSIHSQIVRAEKRGELIAAAYLSQYRSLCAEFGLTPSSRARIKAGNGEKKDDFLD